jgi:hypothetical protein
MTLGGTIALFLFFGLAAFVAGVWIGYHEGGQVQQRLSELDQSLHKRLRGIEDCIDKYASTLEPSKLVADLNKKVQAAALEAAKKV